MAALDTVRSLIQDSGSVPRFSDADLNVIMDDAMMELNVWAESTYTVADLETAGLVPLSHHQIFYILVKIRVVSSEIANVDKSMKFITQDTQIDGSGAASKLNRTLVLLQKELDHKLTWFLGIKKGAMPKHDGQEWGGS